MNLFHYPPVVCESFTCTFKPRTCKEDRMCSTYPGKSTRHQTRGTERIAPSIWRRALYADSANAHWRIPSRVELYPSWRCTGPVFCVRKQGACCRYGDPWTTWFPTIAPRGLAMKRRNKGTKTHIPSLGVTSAACIVFCWKNLVSLLLRLISPSQSPGNA